MSTAASHPTSPTAARGTARFHLQLDGAVLLVFALAAYAASGSPWWFFLVVLLAPDLFMLGYLRGPAVGALVYNAGHTLLLPLLLIGVSVVTGELTAVIKSQQSGVTVLSVGLIWAAHIGMDRMLGYGYKYPTHFKDTEIGRA